MPGASVVYLGDTARVPYGSKSPNTIRRYSSACLRFLLAREVDLVLIACNTASANALDTLTEESPVPVIGAVGPGASSAAKASSNSRIGVIGTLSTIASKAYVAEILSRRQDAAVTQLACPLLVPLAEEGWVDDAVAVAVARRYLEELFTADPDIDTLVLGCTHYPLLLATIDKVASELANGNVAIVDSATAMADESARRVGEQPVQSGSVASLNCYVTDASRLEVLGPRFLGEPLSGFELVDL